jgi:hypothetical protein
MQTSVQQKAERPAALRDQPFESGRFLTGVPVDEKSTTDTSQHETPQKSPVPESFWRGIPCRRYGIGEISPLNSAQRRDRQRVRQPLTQRLWIPDGFRKTFAVKHRGGKCGEGWLRPATTHLRWTTDTSDGCVGDGPEKSVSVFTEAIRRQPVRGCFDGSACLRLPATQRKRQDKVGPESATFKAPSYGRCGVHNRPKLRAGTVAP